MVDLEKTTRIISNNGYPVETVKITRSPAMRNPSGRTPKFNMPMEAMPTLSMPDMVMPGLGNQMPNVSSNDMQATLIILLLCCVHVYELLFLRHFVVDVDQALASWPQSQLSVVISN